MEGGEERSNVSRSGAFGRRSRTKAQASQSWIHAAFRPCGTRAAFAATDVVPPVPKQKYTPRTTLSTWFYKSLTLYQGEMSWSSTCGSVPRSRVSGNSIPPPRTRPSAQNSALRLPRPSSRFPKNSCSGKWTKRASPSALPPGATGTSATTSPTRMWSR